MRSFAYSFGIAKVSVIKCLSWYQKERYDIFISAYFEHLMVIVTNTLYIKKYSESNTVLFEQL